MTETKKYYQIEAHSLGILGVASHDFWVLRGSDGTIQQELHGLATHSSTDKYEDAIDIGTIEDELGFFNHRRYGGTSVDRASVVMYQGTEEDILARWDAAVNAITYLNNLHLTYTPFGFFDPSGAINSNSAFHIFGDIMGVAIKDFDWRIEPGFDTDLKYILDHYAQGSVPPINLGSGNKILVGDDTSDILRGDTGNDYLNGNGGDDLLRGDLGDDSLIGGAGSDSLFGDTGDDILIGGGGNDSLQGDDGFDTYIINQDDGFDTIRDDINGEGEVWLADKQLKGRHIIGANKYSDGSNTYDLLGSTLIIEVNSDSSCSAIVINKFKNHDLGIHLTGDAKDEPLKGNGSGGGGGFTGAWHIMSPIVLDLNGDGLATTSLQNGVYFDHDNNGYAEQSGWINRQDGLLVLDRNQNASIDSGRELFGSETLLTNGQRAANGYVALAEFDSNSDGQIDAQDSIYSTLRIWQDRNGDGSSRADELLTLIDAGVQSIATAYTVTSQTDNGNSIQQISTFSKTDGSTGNSADIWFQSNERYNIPTQLLPETSAVAALPNLPSYHYIPDLHQAMLRDGSGHLQTVCH